MREHIFGIRHHGPGSSRSLLSALEALKPDILLVEGPPEGEAVLPLMVSQDLEPPVALLLYPHDNPSRAVYYPFAAFSPEFVSLRWALEREIQCRFIDLPAAVGFDRRAKPEQPVTQLEERVEGAEEVVLEPTPERPQDPLLELAQAAGFEDFERWWEYVVESRSGTEVFTAVLEAMSVLREHQTALEENEAMREAHMRQCIRTALKEGFSRVAVVCGAWHAPLLNVGLEIGSPLRIPSAHDDARLLTNLPKIKIQSTWIPWTYSRLSSSSGYGAGVESPAWYAHLWHTEEHITEKWMTKVARMLRDKDMDASSAHIIEAVRLAGTVATIRGRPLPDLRDMLEAAESIFASGNPKVLELIGRELIVGEKLGRVPADSPTVPLARDLERLMKKLRLKQEAVEKDLDFDLRKDGDLERSYLLHRLTLLGVPWGQLMRTGGGQSTFHELWRVQWQPEFSVRLIEAARYGAEVDLAASARVRERTLEAQNLLELSSLLDSVLLADLRESADGVLSRLDSLAATSSDVTGLLAALPPLARVSRYGNVRRTDAGSVDKVLEHLLSRACVGLPNACASLDDEAAASMQTSIVSTHEAVLLLQRPDLLAPWLGALDLLTTRSGIHGLVAGRCLRTLLERDHLERDELLRRIGQALSGANPPAEVAAWVEGFLSGSGTVLLHDDSLWGVLDGWVAGLSPDAFVEILPLLRRTFSSFAPAERRMMGEKAKQGAGARARVTATELDVARAERVLPLLEQLLGLNV